MGAKAGVKTANRARVVEDVDGRRWIEKDLALATARYGDWPLACNERLAGVLAEAVGVRVPPLTVEGTVVRSLWSGTALSELDPDAIRDPELRGYIQDQLPGVLLFAAWIGDSDRTVHHVLVSPGGALTSVDFEFCGWKPPGCRYPEVEPPLEAVEHLSCLHAFRLQRPTSERLRRAFPERVPPYDCYPHNASAALFAIREFGATLSDGGGAAAVLRAITALVEPRLRELCNGVYAPVTRDRTTAYLLDRAVRLPALWPRWRGYLREQEVRCRR